MGLLTDLLYREREQKQWGWTAPFREAAREAPREPAFEFPPVQDFLAAESECNEEPIKAARPAPKPVADDKFNPPSQTGSKWIESKLIETLETDYFTTVIYQNGDEYVGKIKFVSDIAGKRSINLLDVSLSRLRLSLGHAAQQGVSKEDRAFVQDESVRPSNQTLQCMATGPDKQ
jgi:hypothetical protein